MPRIITCFKWVVDQADIRVVPGTDELSLDRVGYRISEYDRNCLEEGARLKEQYGGEVVGLTVGIPGAKKSIKDALSRGPEKAYFVTDPSFSNLEPGQTAAIMAAAISSQIEYDLIICGEGSGDLYAQQVGPRLAEMLGIPCAVFVNKIEIKEKEAIVECKVEDGVEVLALPLPALITVLPDINTPRVPGLKDTLAAGKKPVEEITLQDLNKSFDPYLETLNVRATSMERTCEKMDAGSEGIAKMVAVLTKAGVIS